MTSDQLTRLRGQSVIDSAGQKIGDIQRVFYDETNNQPAWVTIRGGGRFSGREAFVPLAGAQLGASGLAVAVRKEIVEDAPAIDAGNEMTADDAARLDRYYEGMLNGPAPQLQPPPQPMPTSQMPAAAPAQPAQPAAPRRPEPMPAPPPTRTESATRETATRPAELTSFEEQIRVGTEAVESGTVRLRKYVVTEPVETTVPIRHEEVAIERMPVTSTTPTPGHRFEEQAVEVTLHEERPTIAKETVPVETVRLASKTETEQRRVSDQVRRERIEVEDQRLGNAPGGPTRRR